MSLCYMPPVNEVGQASNYVMLSTYDGCASLVLATESEPKLCGL